MVDRGPGGCASARLAPARAAVYHRGRDGSRVLTGGGAAPTKKT